MRGFTLAYHQNTPDMKDTKRIHITDTVHFHHKFILAPSKTPENMALLTIKLVQLNKIDKQTLKQLNDIFATAVNTKNQLQPQSKETNMDVPNTPPLTPTNEPATHLSVQPHVKP